MNGNCSSCEAANHDSLIELLVLISIASKKAAKQLLADDLEEKKVEVRKHAKDERAE